MIGEAASSADSRSYLFWRVFSTLTVCGALTFKKTLILILAALPVFAAPVLRPANEAVVKQGATLTITSSVPVTWSMTAGSAGTLTPIDSTHAVYTAPASIPVPSNIYGCGLPPDHVYTTRIDDVTAFPVNANNAAYMDSLTAAVYRIAFSVDFPGNTVNNATRVEEIISTYSNPSGPAVKVPILPIHQRQQEGGTYIAALNGPGHYGDGHLLSVNKDTCRAYEMYQYYPAGTNAQGCALCNSQSVVAYPLLSSTLPPNGIDAAGMPSQPLLVRASEIRSGVIKHAFRFSTRPVGGGYVWPATGAASGPGNIKYGTRFRLKASFDATETGATCSAVTSPAYCSTLLTALKNYGAFAVDGTVLRAIDISGDGDIGSDPEIDTLFRQLTGLITITNENWEAIDESSLQDSHAANPGLAALVPPSLGNNATEIVATPMDRGANAYLRIINEGGAIGFDAHDGYRYIQSGATTTFTANVTGLPATNVTWSMSPPVGTLDTATGIYTAPMVSVPTTTTITATSTVDSSVSGSFVVSVFPPLPLFSNFGDLAQGSPSPGSIVDGQYIDSSGNTWYTNYLQPNYYRNTANDNSLRQFSNTTGYDIFPISSEAYYLGDSMVMATMNPGNYTVQPIMYWPFTPAELGSPLENARLMVDTQGQIVARDVDLVRDTFDRSTRTITPIAPIYPATVGPDGRFYFSLRRYSNIYTGPAKMAGLVIREDTGSPHLTIDNPGGDGSAAHPGSSHSLGCVSWSGLGPGCTFIITSGSGSITATDGTSATYKAPATPPLIESPETVTIMAVSTADSTKTATTTFVRVFGTLAITTPYPTITRDLSQQFTANLSGTPYTNVTWSANTGSITSGGLWTAPSITSDTSAIITATSKDDPTQTATSTVNVRAVPAGMYISAFGSLTDTAGHRWEADPATYSSPQGQTVSIACTPACNGYGDESVAIAGVADAAQMRLYQHARYGFQYSNPIGDFTYTFGIPPGVYSVTLKFADYTAGFPPNYFGLNFVANGVRLLNNYNFASEAGAARTAVDRVFTVQNLTNSLALQFNHAGARIPQVNAISVEYVSPLPEGTRLTGASKK